LYWNNDESVIKTYHASNNFGFVSFKFSMKNVKITYYDSTTENTVPPSYFYSPQYRAVLNSQGTIINQFS
jgi:hypothetical protein